MKTKKKGRSTYKLSTQEKKHIELLERAAKRFLTTDEEFACCAIDSVAGRFSETLSIFESVYMKDADGIRDFPWWKLWDFDNYKQMKECRMFALLLTTELIRTNSLP